MSEMFFYGLLMGGLLVLALSVAFSMFRVDEGHVGLLTAFKAARRKPDGTLLTFPPGLHFKRPWDVVKQINMMEQALALPDEGGKEAIAEDGTVLKLEADMRYSPVEGGLDKFVFGVARPAEHLQALFAALMRNELANVRAPNAQQLGGSYALIRRDRKGLDQRLEQLYREQLDMRYGVRFRGVDVTDIHPPDELADALNAVIAAKSHAEEMYFRAEGDAQSRVLSAKEGVEIAKFRARAAQDEIQILCNALTELELQKTLGEYVRRRRAEVLSESRALFLKEGVAP